MSETTPFAVSRSGVVHVWRCSAAQSAAHLEPWTEASQAPLDRRCLLCFPAVSIGYKPKRRRTTPADASEPPQADASESEAVR